MDRVYRGVTPAFLRTALRNSIRGTRLSAALHRKLEHTFLMRDGASWPSFYFDNFYSAFSHTELASLLTDNAMKSAGTAYDASMNVWEHSSGDLMHRLLYTDLNSYLVELLMKQDQMSMAASIESRVPFLDHPLVEFTATIPAQYQIRGLAGKFILKDAVVDLLPHDIVYRKKMGFPTPWAYWLAGPQLAEIEALLVEPRSLERNIFRVESLRQILFEHRTGHRDHGNRIWRLLNFELWQRVFIDGEDVSALADIQAGVLTRP
jgi:asparagine synthase (glutamine-hydrolysing)